ncbi:MAG: EAL domain-containing protein [Nitrospirae bacterium]|nr:EAL domain-containing protein [Nitrospirota bacterium]
MKKNTLSLSQKALLAVTIILLPILIVFIINYYKNRRHLEENALNDLTALAGAYEGQIYQFLEMSRRRAQDFSSDGFITNSLQEIIRGNAAAVAGLNEHISKNKMVLDSTIHDMHVLSLDGHIVISTYNSLIGKDMSDQPFFLNGKNGVSITESKTFHPDAPELAISTPILSSGTRKHIGVLVNFILLSDINKVLSGELAKELGAISWDKGKRKTMDAYIVNKDKLLITDSISAKNAVLKQKVDTEAVRACLQSNKEITGFYKNYRDVLVAGASICIPSLKWTLMVEVNADEVYAPSREILRSTILAGALVATLIGGLLLLFLRVVVNPIKRIADTSKDIASGNYDIQLAARTNDEIGVLSDSFNRMAADISTNMRVIKKSEENYRRLVENVNDIIYKVTIEDDPFAGNVEFLSMNTLSLIGYRPEEFMNDPRLWSRIIHPDDITAVVDITKKIFEGHKADVREYRLRHKETKKYLWFEDKVVPILNDEGKTVAIHGVARDITDRKLTEEKDHATRDRMARQQAAVVKLATTIPLLTDSLNSALHFITEVTAKTLNVERVFVFSLSEDRKELKSLDQFEKTSGTHSSGAILSIDQHEDFLVVIEKERVIAAYDAQTDLRIRELSNEYLIPFGIVSKLVVPIRLSGKLVGILCIGQTGEKRRWSPDEETFASEVGDQITQAFTLIERKRDEADLRRLSAGIEHSVNIIYITDPDGNIEYVNPQFEQLTGYSKKEAIGRNPRILMSGETTAVQYKELWRTITGGKIWRGVFKNKKKNGEYFWVNTIISPVKNEKGDIINFLAIQEDITEKIGAEESIRHLRAYDALTGLVNRTHFLILLNRWIYHAKDANETGVLLLIDLDQFRFINDTYGHNTGDEILCTVAKLLQNTIKDIDTSPMGPMGEESIVAYLASDEFAILLPQRDESEGLSASEEIRERLEGLHFLGLPGRITASIGIVLYPNHGNTTSELLKYADIAMSRAKDMGGNRCHIFDPTDHDLEHIHSNIEWKEFILKAIEDDRFEPWFQPILDLSNNKVCHYEALARIRNKDETIVSPGTFIDVADRFKITGLIDRVIIEKAMRVQAEKSLQGDIITLSINLSGRDLGDEGFLSFIQSKINETGADPDYLVFEITETAAVQHMDNAIKFIKAVKDMGCHFALDDFGVGFSSFLYLKMMEVDYIKIDGAFVKKLYASPTDQLFVKSIINVAKGMGIKTIAEFVETKETLDLLREYGVDLVQGYYSGKPAPFVGSSLKSRAIKN